MDNQAPTKLTPRDSRAWAIVLAAGDGTRLHALTTVRRGLAIPKQFCSLAGGPSLLRQALTRASLSVPMERVLVVVAEQHRRWWEPELETLPVTPIVQPANRGTAAGVLLPLLRLLELDPAARVLLVPSDHFVDDEQVLATAARAALERVAARKRIVLLGVTPSAPAPGYGWIAPGLPAGRDLSAVSSFIEKPDRSVARSLQKQGGLWNTFLLAARARHLAQLYGRTLPELTSTLESAIGSDTATRTAYRRLEVLDFSRELLQRSVGALEVLRVADCGWDDLGTPERVGSCIRRLKPRRRRDETLVHGPLDLSAAHRRFASSL